MLMLFLKDTLMIAAYPVVNVYVVDVVTGHMVFHGNHRKAQGPLHVIHSENWLVVSYLLQ